MPSGGGLECDTRSACQESPCLHGTCTDSLDSNGALNTDAFRCSCEPGWTGKTCAIGSCHSSPCQNGGTCTVDAAEVAKVHLCEDAASCKSIVDAVNHQLGMSCAELPQSVRQFGKKKLSLASYCPSTCVGHPCKTGAMLHSASPRYTCTCAPGYYGPSCELHRCADDPVWKYLYSGNELTCSMYTAPWMRPSCAKHTGKDAKGHNVTAAVACQKSCAICTATPHTACLSSPCQHGGSCQDVSECADQHTTCPTLKMKIAALDKTCSSVLDAAVNPALAGKRLQDECCATCGGGFYKCKCTSAYTGPECQTDKSKSTIVAELRQTAVLSQCARSSAQGLSLLPVDTATSNFTLKVIRGTDITIDDCQQKCCEDERCVSFVFTTSATKSGVCKLKSVGPGCDCHCDQLQSTQAPDCEYAKMAPMCSKMCDDTPRGDTLYTVTHPGQPLRYCTLNVFQRGLSNFTAVFGLSQGAALIGTMANYISPFSKLFNFENICRGLYQKLENQETVCGASLATGLSSSPQTTIECSGHLPIFVVMTLCANPCMADKTCAPARTTPALSKSV